jgi:nitrogen fixation protein FixH
MEQSIKDPKDKFILLYFLLFFGTIILLDGIFIYFAISTHTGVVTEQAYERGLDFNSTISKAANQPNIQHHFSYNEHSISWKITEANGKPIDNAIVTANIIRPVIEGYDFKVHFKHVNDGLYETQPEFPLKGLWSVKLNSKWEDKQFQSSQEIIVK